MILLKMQFYFEKMKIIENLKIIKNTDAYANIFILILQN